MSPYSPYVFAVCVIGFVLLILSFVLNPFLSYSTFNMAEGLGFSQWKSKIKLLPFARDGL